MIDLICYYPKEPNLATEVEVTEIERKATYDVIMKAFLYKYTYEIKKMHRETNIECYNLNNFKVYNSILEDLNTKIHDKFTRDFVLLSLQKIKANDFSKKSVQQTYKTVSEWFATNSFKGQTFRNNILNGEPAIIINFPALFSECNTTAIKENSKCFEKIKNLYKNYQSQISNIL